MSGLVLCPGQRRGLPEVNESLGGSKSPKGLGLGMDCTYYCTEKEVGWLLSSLLSKSDREMSGTGLGFVVKARFSGLLALPF